MITLGVLVSGGGTNLQAIIDAIARGELDARIAVVVSSNPEAYGLVRAENAGIPHVAMQRSDYDDPTAADEAIVRVLGEHGVEYVVMAGYMRMVRQPLLDAFPNRIVNLHPALLPSFAGAHGIADAFAHGVKVTGVTVHFANAEMDAGPIIAQRAVEVLPDDTLDTLEERIHEVEHEMYPQVLGWLADGRVEVQSDGKVRIYE